MLYQKRKNQRYVHKISTQTTIARERERGRVGRKRERGRDRQKGQLDAQA